MWTVLITIKLLLANTSLDSIPVKDYNSTIASIKEFRAEINLQNDSVLTIQQAYLDSLIVSTLFPYWYGTKWDFNGYSNTPGQGQIACGYFVSTPLKHIGYNWNRFRLAQQDATTIIIKITNNRVLYYRNRDTYDFINDTKKLEDGLYVLGLDSHVGFLYKWGNTVRVIHSSYYGGICVMDEMAEDCAALFHSNSYVLGRLNSKENLKRWKNNTRIEI